MPRKKKQRRRVRRSAIAPWVILAGSLAVIGFACTRTAPHGHTAATRGPIAQATALGTPVSAASVAPPIPAVTSPPAANASPPAAVAGPEASAVPRHENASAPPATQAPAVPRSTPVSEPPRPRAPGEQPRLALIIDDCGQWLDTERGFIALPVTLTLSVLPDVRYNQTIEREATDGNKGVMLHLPMETLSGLNPGPGKITTEMDDTAISAQIEHDLGNVDLARGVNNHEGSKATADARVMNDLMTVLARHDRFFIDSRTNGASVAEQIATQRGVATAGRDVFLDNRADVTYTEGQLRAAAAIAKRDGSAIAIGHPRPTTLTAVRAMIPELQADGIKFVLAADLAH